MRMSVAFGTAGCVATAFAAVSLAGPERVPYPEGYADRFVLYNQVDRPDRGIVRFMYVSPESHEQAADGASAPDGTVLIMEDHPAALDADGAPLLGPDGRLIPSDEVTAVFVMEKQPGWGDTLPAETRNGDWDYAAYLADGSPRPDTTFDGCFGCHMNRSGSDFTFTYSAYLRDRDRQ